MKAAPASRRTWTYYLIFLAAGFLLSYLSWPPWAWWTLMSAGVLLPLVTAFAGSPSPRKGETASCFRELSLTPPAWLWALALAALVFLRFNRLTTFPAWPTLDEGWIGTLALQLSRHWTWRFFYTFGQAPPLPVWCAALLLKAGASPAFSLWFPSALVSLATVAAFYAAARRFFSRSFALACGGLAAFSTWPLLTARVCHEGIWLPLWTALCFWAWGGFQKARPSGARARWALGLGLLLGLGSFTFTPWLWVAALLLATFGGVLWSKPGKDRHFLPHLLAAFALGLVPFLHAVAAEGFGKHILSLSPWGGWSRWSDLPAVFFHYLTALFWRPGTETPAYTPVTGGFLDPFLGAFFFLGLVHLLRFRKNRLLSWTAGAFLLFLLPGGLSLNVEAFRVAQVMPLLIFITALGLHSFLETWPAPRRLRLLALLLALVGCLNYHLLASPTRNPEERPRDFGRPLKSLERYRAYQILDSLRQKEGPGLVLTDFDTQSFNDPTLSVMAYPFNAARNPDLSPDQCRWLALFVAADYEPFLRKRFPGGRWFRVGRGLGLENGGDLLGVLPVTAADAKTLGRWVEAHSFFQQADLERFEEGGGPLDGVVRTLERAYPLVQGDRFLESVFWDKRAAYEYVDLHYDQNLLSYRMALARGYPTASLYFKLGELLLVGGREAEAKAALRRAARAPLDLTQARPLLEALSRENRRPTGNPPRTNPAKGR